MPDLTEPHQALARVVLNGRDLTEVLTEIAGIARRAMPESLRLHHPAAGRTATAARPGRA